MRILTAPEGKTQRMTDAVKITLGEGKSFGEMGLIDSGPRSATVKAVTETQLIVIDCQQFRELIETDINLGYQIMKNIAIDLSFKLRYRNLIWDLPPDYILSLPKGNEGISKDAGIISCRRGRGFSHSFV